MLYQILRTLTLWIFRITVIPFCTPTDIRNIERLKNIQGPLILAANHDGRIDPVWITLMVHRSNPGIFKDIRFFAWHTFYDMPILGWYIRNMRSYRLINKQGLQVLDPGVEFLNEGGMIGIFPEGKIRKLTAKDKRAKRGIAYLAWKSQAPILPIYIKYHRRWKNLPFYRLEFAVGEQFIIHDIIKSEHDLQQSADQVLGPIYDLASK